ncbi:uncharacterized protein F5Z01DRAFT_648895 [Emericellopsis atlantica]|uniref:Rhodopsin domain-containing protein n=1 Tax=Emericellopsis atlantica TaxID=2614577 RepID=A0A9P7ZQY4_9HYPO|nr:uncharacterized protein F5Z01DRAFT_648895 [Emericellopsis atlantica]KAG9256689.1 hypothetical protein F5Z01DRAFT_648895 [Emericellopsis atlantica]
MIKSFGYDDAMMILAWAFLFCGGIVAQIYAGNNGALGRHKDAVMATDPSLMEVYGKMSFVQGICVTVTANCLLKLSIGMSLLRLNSNKWYKRIVWSLVLFVICYFIEGIVTVMAYCDSLEAHWDPKVKETAKCYSEDLRNTLGTINTAFNVFTDVIFASVPVPMLWTLQTKLNVRLYLIGIFSLGYLTVAVGLVKMFYQLTGRNDPDKTFNNRVQFYGLLQLNVGLLTACAPMIKPLVAKTLGIHSSSAVSTAPVYASSRNRQRPNPAGYVREDGDHGFELAKYDDGQYHTTTVRGGGGSDSNSETHILPEGLGSKGVMKTTQVIINRDQERRTSSRKRRFLFGKDRFMIIYEPRVDVISCTNSVGRI